MSEAQLTGRMVPKGKAGQFEFLSTEFLDCYENGGVFLFDELDAADPNVLLVINSALANGRLPIPNRHDKPVALKHADFICIAAANTWGRGADRQYVGRNQLDESTLDRFRIGTVPMDYNEDLERHLCPIPELFDRLRAYRERIRLNRLERLVSTRFIRDAAEMVARWGWTDEQVDEQLFAGWRRDEIAKIKG
jgi:MoxR-like ATPase